MPKCIIFLLVFCSFQINPNPEFGKFISNFAGELNAYQEVSDLKEIPKKLFKRVNKWKEKQYYLEYGKKISKDEKSRFFFELADKDEPYNASCMVQKGLPYRKFQFAGRSKDKWVISYLHGQGRVHNNKLLIVDMKQPDQMTVFYIWSKHKYLENLSELEEYLKAMELNSKSEMNSCYLMNGDPCGNKYGNLSF